jgi:hypothetical protein
MHTPPTADPRKRPNQEAAPPRDAGDAAFVREWLDHVAAGNIGGGTPVNAAARAIVLANERLICGRQRTIID